MIYLDNAATTRPCPAALDAMRTALEDAWGNPSALYRPGQQARKLVEDARRTVARVLHAARPAEITFTSGGTESDVQALYTGAALGAAAGKRHIISTQIEHHAVLHTLQALQIQGFDKDGSKKPVKSRLCGQQQAMRQLKLNKFTEQGYRFHQWYPFSVAPHGRHRYKNLWRFFVPIFGKEPDR